MKFSIIKCAAAGAILVGAFGATSAQAATADASSLAKILSQVTLAKTTDLQFGTIVRSASASTVDVSTAGARTCGTGLVCTGVTTAAAFDITGSGGQVVAISIPTSVTLNSGGNSMTASIAASAASATLSGAGTASFTVGGTLNVGANQADGDYVGAFTATADYQ
jgi:hypothetical protein